MHCYSPTLRKMPGSLRSGSHNPDLRSSRWYSGLCHLSETSGHSGSGSGAWNSEIQSSYKLSLENYHIILLCCQIYYYSAWNSEIQSPYKLSSENYHMIMLCCQIYHYSARNESKIFFFCKKLVDFNEVHFQEATLFTYMHFWIFSNICSAPIVPSFSVQWKSNEHTKHYVTQIMLTINWHYLLAEKNSRMHMKVKVAPCKYASLKSTGVSQKKCWILF